MTDRNRGGGGWSFRGPELVGVVLIVVGIAYFLGNTGIIRIGWDFLWPVLVIGIGVAVLLSAMRPAHDGSGSASLPRDGTQQLELNLAAGGGTFHVGGGAVQLLDVRSNHDDIVMRVDRNGPRSRVRLQQDMTRFPFGGRATTDWGVSLADDVPTALSIQGGAGSFDVDLSTLRIVDARVSIGAAQVRLTLPHPMGEVSIRISSGAASVAIQVPAGVEANVAASGGLMQVDGRTETPGYATARDRVTVSVTGGASTVRIS